MDNRPPLIPPRSTGTAAATGFMWLFGQTVVLKAASVVGRIALAYWLTPEDFGLVGLADTVVMVALLVQRYGLREQLIRLGPRIDEWTNAGFWLSVITGALGAGLILVASPWAVRFYGEPRLTGLLVFLGLTSPFMTIPIVPLSRLESDLRFRQVAFVNTVSGTSATLLAVLCAVLGLGAFSLIVPRAAVALGTAAALFWMVKPRIRWSIDAARWPYLLSGGGLLLFSSLAALAVGYGDYAVIGRLLGTEAVGLYYFAFGLSTQTGVLLTDNLGRVLLPALSSLLGQPQARQRGAFVRSCRLLALLGVPLCLLQAAVAGPLVRLLFGPRWAAAIPILQLLSVGMAGHLLTMPSHTLLKAQGRLRTLFVMSAAAAGCFLTVVTVAAARGGLIVATATVAAYYLVAGFVQLGVALRAIGGRWRDLAHVCTVAFAAGGASVTLGWACGQLMPAGRLYDLLRLIAIPGIGLGLHALCVRVFAPDAWRDLRATITAVAGQTFPSRLPNGGD